MRISCTAPNWENTLCHSKQNSQRVFIHYTVHLHPLRSDNYYHQIFTNHNFILISTHHHIGKYKPYVHSLLDKTAAGLTTLWWLHFIHGTKPLLSSIIYYVLCVLILSFYLFICNITIVLFVMLTLADGSCWLLRSPCTVCGDCTSSMSL